jgi:PHP family Zn ribbon phosphoesterase
MVYRADFHIHSCLSPCGSLEMSPVNIIERAREVGLNLIAVTDHNCARNAPALAKVCSRYDDIQCLYGVEATSVEEVHNLCLFDDVETAVQFGDLLYSKIQKMKNNPDRFGDQVYVDEEETIIGECEYYLGSASSYTIEELCKMVHQRGGIFIPAHIDRASCSMSSQLGFVPLNDYDALEIHRTTAAAHVDVQSKIGTIQNAERYPLITNSDSHQLSGLGQTIIEFELESPTVKNISSAFLSGSYSIKSFAKVY